MKRTIKLRETELKQMIAESVNNILMETAETIGPFVNNRAVFSGLKTKKEQMDSDWNDLRDTYPYGGEIPFDYQDAEEALSNEEDWNMSQYSKPKRIEDYMDESNIHKIVKESIKNILKEQDGTYETDDDYYESFYKNVLAANESLYRALSFCGDNMKSDILVKNIRKAFQYTNETAYYIEQRRKKKL